MKSIDEQILRTAKEIVVKFIEMGRLSPSNVHETFKDIHETVNKTVKQSMDSPHHDTTYPQGRKS
ncbi:MAG: conjugal transfer protein TraB [Desulfobacterales bacterium]|nr:MAG: conjugal transfer protein TraB [Desulfobacterales bacterium]